MLTALFNFVWNTQKNKWTIFLNAQAKCFLVLKRFLKRKGGPTLNAMPFCFSPPSGEKGVRNIVKQN